jgi:arginine:pyruvate transaminase
MTCLLNAGDEIVIPEPMYVGYPSIMQALDAQVVAVPLDVKSGFGLDLPLIKSSVTDRTRVLFLNTPGNPTGSIISATELRELATFCRERGVWLVCDEVYSMFTYDGQHRSARASVKHLDNIVMIDGLSKSHAMSGWRMGWVIAPPQLIERLGAYSAATLFGSPQFIQDASAFALENDQAYVASMRKEYRARRDFVLHKLSKVGQLSCSRPRAGMFIMCDVAGTGLSGREFAEQLLSAEQVSVVPGDAFGPSAAGFVRIGLAQNQVTLRKACKRIRRFCESL